MIPDAPDLDHLTQVISHATAPAFLLGAVAGFLSILVTRLERTIDRHRVVRARLKDRLRQKRWSGSCLSWPDGPSC